VTSFITKRALAIVFAAGLGNAVALSQSPLPRPESNLSVNAAGVDDWANRLLANDPKVRATADAALVQGAHRSLPLLRRFLDADHEELHDVTFEIIRRIGPPAIPLLVELLRHQSESIRRSVVDVLIDLAPHTEGIQPALRRALRDEDAMVAGDAARALGALGKRASPSVGALVNTLSHDDAYVRVYAAEALASIGPGAARATHALAEALRDPVPGVRWAACEPSQTSARTHNPQCRS
jgi:HEAT repeat protein